MKIQDLFEPLSAKYCDYFWIGSVIFFLITCMSVLTILMSLVQGKNKMKLSEMLVFHTSASFFESLAAAGLAFFLVVINFRQSDDMVLQKKN